ncbi:hypothetical protein [Aeromonas popoffii]|uniref:hypothetical protein n=1 Tax=Aeromonas popoffii TaxID=70856 RepID=UPI0030CBD4BF
MSTITEMQNKMNIKTLNFALLGLVTGSIYNVLWLNKANRVIGDTTKIKLVDSAYIIWLCICLGLSYMLSGTGDEILDVLSGALTIANLVLHIVWAFKARAVLMAYALNEHRVDLKMNAFYTVIFHVFYINYCINDLSEAERKQRVLSGQEAS